MNNESGNRYNSSDFLKLLMNIKDRALKDTNVAEIGIITKINLDEIYCNLINTDEYIICKSLKNLELKENDKVVIIFTNTDFRDNLKRINNNAQPQFFTNTDDITYHSKSYGIIIGII